MTYKLSLGFVVSFTFLALLSSCTSVPYTEVQKGEYQITGHPYKTAVDCEREAPIGTFDGKCDIPVVGYRNFADPTIGIHAGGIGGSGLGF